MTPPAASHPPLDADRLAEVVAEHFHHHAAGVGLNPAQLRVDYVLNPGGFTNASFRISDGDRAYHLKLADAPHRVARLRRWYTLRDAVEERYRAPHILEWINLPQAGGHGLLFEHLPGHTAHFRRAPVLLGAVFALSVILHRDAELTNRLPPLLAADAESLPPTHRDSFLDTYVHRFRGDLQSIAANRPAFVSAGSPDWMCDETDALARVASADPFAAPATAPIHGDLNELNVLAAPRRRWYVLDWDDLALGDPALDYAMLLWPVLCDRPLSSPAAWRDALPARVAPPRDPALDERMALYLRAQSLDGVIDSLANYLDAAATAEHRVRVQAQTRRDHLAALRRYRAHYG